MVLKIEIIDSAKDELIDFLNKKIEEFNWKHWEVRERKPIAVKVSDNQGLTIGGAAGRTFGDWLLLDTLWVREESRGMNIGSQLLTAIEKGAKSRSCIRVLLDTLNFQAMPFYQRHGYTIEWKQEGCPKTGCKYFMTKLL